MPKGLSVTSALKPAADSVTLPSLSLMVACEDQAEIDHLWTQLPADGGKEKACGWVEDAWGLSWQIIPKAWFDMIRDPDPARVQRVFQAIWQMQKIDVAALQRAYG